MTRDSDRVLHQRIEEAGAGVEAGQLAAQRDAEIEAEAVDVVFLDPVAQRIEGQLDHARVREVDRVAATGVVDAIARIVRLQSVVGGIVQTAQAQGRAALAAFAGVVVDHVEQHFDARGVQRLDGGLEFAGSPSGQIARLGREIAQCVVAPVVDQAALDQRAVVHNRAWIGSSSSAVTPEAAAGGRWCARGPAPPRCRAGARECPSSRIVRPRRCAS